MPVIKIGKKEKKGKKEKESITAPSVQLAHKLD